MRRNVQNTRRGNLFQRGFRSLRSQKRRGVRKERLDRTRLFSRAAERRKINFGKFTGCRYAPASTCCRNNPRRLFGSRFAKQRVGDHQRPTSVFPRHLHAQ